LLARRDEIEPVLARHGLALRVDVLEDSSRRVWECVEASDRASGRRRAREAGLTGRLDHALDRLDAVLAAEPEPAGPAVVSGAA
jgi:hypothetical protein